jgi:hypothetical protein
LVQVDKLRAEVETGVLAPTALFTHQTQLTNSKAQSLIAQIALNQKVEGSNLSSPATHPKFKA